MRSAQKSFKNLSKIYADAKGIMKFSFLSMLYNLRKDFL